MQTNSSACTIADCTVYLSLSLSPTSSHPQSQSPKLEIHNAKATILFLPFFSHAFLSCFYLSSVVLITTIAFSGMSFYTLPKTLPFDPFQHPVLTIRSLQLRQVLSEAISEAST